MHNPSLCHHAVSVTFMYSDKTIKHIFRIFSLLGSHAILVFPYQTSWHYSDGDPFNGSIGCRWGMKKIAISDQYLASPRVVNTATIRFYQHSAAGQWRVGDTH